MNKFWMVWNEQGGASTYKHSSYDSAKLEAKRLARLHPGEEIHVLELSGTAIKHDVEWKTPRPEGLWFAYDPGA